MGAVASGGRCRIKRNDMVMVIAGRDCGKTGKVLRVVPGRSKVVVERLNVVKRHSRPRGAASPGGIVEKEAAIHVSNVMVMCDRCNAPVRVGMKPGAEGKHVRVCRRCGEALGNE